MEKIRRKPKDKELSEAFKEVEDNALGNPLIFNSVPSAKDMKVNTIGKVKDKTDYLYIKFSDGKMVKVPVNEVS